MCSECGKAFYRENVLNNHVYLVHDLKKKEAKFECQQCGKQFKLKSLLQKHLPIHRVKEYQCSICDKLFSTKWNKTVHEMKH